jgi:hypothetical protein
MKTRIASFGLIATVIGMGAVLPASADEPQVKPAPAPMILNLLTRPLESPESAFNKQLKNDIGAPLARRNDAPEVLPDGSVRYGSGSKSVTVTIKNPCPPGDIDHELAQMRAERLERQLPGRRR